MSLDNFPALKDVCSGIQHGIALIAKHPSVQSIDDIVMADAGAVDLHLVVQLELPLSWMAKGCSPNGVRVLEPVVLEFPRDYPFHAPCVRLRADFDRSLAHVQPWSSSEAVYPCIYEGDLNELLHAQGLWAILNQTIDWLQKAALETLIDPTQGWEPIRRDSFKHVLVFDSEFIRQKVRDDREKHFFLPFFYDEFEVSTRSDTSIVYGQVKSEIVQVHQKNVGSFFTTSFAKRCNSLALIVTPGEDRFGSPHVADRYHPEVVSDLESLRQQAKEYGCLNALDTAFRNLRKVLNGWSPFPGQSGRSMLAVILCARRPFALIGEASTIEVIPYLLAVDVATPHFFPLGERTLVLPSAHHHAITRELLRRFSGGTTLPQPRPITLLGCGSLGSKIALHLARSGDAPDVVVDKGLWTPHNAARHALLPSLPDLQHLWFPEKATTTVTALKTLNIECLPFTLDLTTLQQHSKVWEQVFPQDTWGVVNATASLTVREKLSAMTFNGRSCRVIETSLYANSDIGLMTVEGSDRNPNSIDLSIQAYEIMRSDARLQEAMFTGEEVVRPVRLGQGCSSMTMTASDAKISLMSSLMTLAIAKIREQGFQDAGQILLWHVGEDGISVTLKFVEILPVKVISIDNAPGWSVRLSVVAAKKIVQDCAAYPGVETGGILIGQISFVQQAFLVVDILPASKESSKRSSNEFVLGAMQATLQQYLDSCRGSLYCLGTWHSHLTESGASSQDFQTCKSIEQGRVMPSVLLIRTPKGYQAIATLNV